MIKPFCHSANIVHKDFAWTCSECKRDQVGFLGFLWAIAMHTGVDAKEMGGGGGGEAPDELQDLRDEGAHEKDMPE